jgi:sialate O-acetylesterase
MPRTPIALAVALALSVNVASAQAPSTVELPALLSNGAVLQRDSQVAVWGRCAPGAKVEVAATWLPRAVSTTADEQGRFHVLVTTVEAGGPHEVSVSAAGEAATVVSDVWLGEVWLASGQSNMEWSVAAARFDDLDGAAYAAAVREAATERVRFFQVPLEFDSQARDAFDEPSRGAWQMATNEALVDFSAVAFHFARRLERELDVPVGIVQSAWGGTVCEAWASEGALRGNADLLDGYGPALERLAKERDGTSGEATLEERQSQWWAALLANEVGMRERWFAREVDASGWEVTAVPGDPAPGFDGCVWLRRSFEVPAGWAGRELELALGPIDDMDVVWFEGEEIGSLARWNNWNTPRTYRVPAALVKGGRAEVTVLCVDVMGGAGMHGDASAINVRPVDASGITGVASIALDGEWRTKRGLGLGELGGFPQEGWLNQNTPTALFNGMIAPLEHVRLRGAIWYQGESNAWARPDLYARLFPTMIEDWRAFFRPEARGDGKSSGATPAPFPFLAVQLAPWAMPDDDGVWSFVRMAQVSILPNISGLPAGMHTAALDHVAVVPIMDVGDKGDIHPRRKKIVGERLADAALKDTYARFLPASDVRRGRFERLAWRSPQPSELVRTDVAPAAFGEEFANSREPGVKTLPALSLTMLCHGHADVREALATSDGAAPTHFEVAGADGVFKPAVAVLVDVPAIERSPGQPPLPPIRRALILHADGVNDPTHVRFAHRAGDEPNLVTTTGVPVGPFVVSLAPK